MRLSSGARLGSYEILAPIGSGGMGEVYRARDTRLKRDVAVKVLLGAWADETDRLGRFQREAELLAALNHPNIAAIYGVEDIEGIRALILELVEGPTLADRLARGPVPLHEAVVIGRQVINALDTAHEKGIVHRDLKPANVKVRADGEVKVLDFGLAKALESDVRANVDVTASPTMTSPAMILALATFEASRRVRAVDVVDGKATDLVISPATAGLGRADVSPDGRWLAFGSRRQVWIAPLRPGDPPPEREWVSVLKMAEDSAERLRLVAGQPVAVSAARAGRLSGLVRPARGPGTRNTRG